MTKRNEWQIWRDVIFALFVREIRTGFSDKFGISWSVLEPIAFIFILSFIRGRMDGGLTHSIPPFTFIAIGLLMIQSFLSTLSCSARAISKSKPLYAFRQVQPISAVIASALFELLVKTFVVIGIVIVMYFLKMELRVDDAIMLFTCIILLWLLGVSLGMLFGIAEMYVSEIGKLRALTTRPLFFISGTFFSLQDFPREYWHYLNWNPILHAIELTRYAAYNTYGNAGVSLSFLSFVTLVFLFLSLSVYFTYWKQAISR